jgi:hypothetical protein
MRKSISAAVIFLIVITGFGFGLAYAQNASQADGTSAAQTKTPATRTPATDIPAYHASASKDPLPETLDPSQFSDLQTQNVYALAAKVKGVLYQQPCYCRCDKEHGHTSLLSCYTDRHASVCALCQKEAVFSYSESKKGKTAAEIRKEIIDGKWKDVDLSVYEKPVTGN